MSAIYIIEDDEAVREALFCLLEPIAANIETFADAESFLKRQKKPLSRSDTVIVDIGLPGKSGAELLSLLPKGPEAPRRIVITGFERRRLLQRLDDTLYDELIQKPLHTDTISDLINQLSG